MKAGQCL